MNRVVVLVVALLLLGGGFWLWIGSGDGDEVARHRLDEVRRLLRASDVRGARLALEEARDDLPDGWQAHGEGLILLAEGRDREAVDSLVVARRELPDDVEVFHSFAAALLNTSRADEVVEAAEGMLQRHPGDPTLLWILARALMDGQAKKRDPDRALEVLADLEAELEKPTAGERPTGFDPFVFFALQAEAAAQVGQWTTAVRAAETLVRLKPKAAQSHGALGNVLVRAARARVRPGLWERAAVAFQEAALIATGERRWYENHILCLLEIEGRQEQALESSRELLRKVPGDRNFRVLVARSLVHLGDEASMDEADGLLRDLVLQFPDDLEILRNRGIFCFDWKGGGQESDHRADGYRVEAHRHLRRYVSLEGKIDDEIRSPWEDLQRWARENRALVVVDEAAELLRTGHAEEAAALYREAVEIAPETSEFRVGLLRAEMAGGGDPPDPVARTAQLYARWPESAAVRLLRAEVLDTLSTEQPETMEDCLRTLGDVYGRFDADGDLRRVLSRMIRRAGPTRAARNLLAKHADLRAEE